MVITQKEMELELFRDIHHSAKGYFITVLGVKFYIQVQLMYTCIFT